MQRVGLKEFDMLTPETAPTKDATLHPAAQKLLAVLDDVAATAKHEADPRVGAEKLATALAEYFRAPD